MATPARKSLSSRKVSSRSSVGQGSRSTTRATNSRKKPIRTVSTAKSVRSGRARTTASKKSAVSTRTASASTLSNRKKTISTRTQKKRTSSAKKPQNQSPIFSFLRGVAVSLFFLATVFLLGWFFILPSVLLSTTENKNIVYVSNDISSLNGKILFAHINKNKEKSALYILDGTEEVAVPNGYGTYAIGVVPSLLKMEQHTDSTVKSIMSRIFGLPIDEVIMAVPLSTDLSERGDGADVSRLAGVLRANALQTMFEDPRQALLVLRLSFLAQNTTRVQDLGSYQKTNALISTSALKLLPEEKQCSVAVINTTGKQNLARDTAQLLEQNGVYVVREDSTALLEERTLLQVSSESKPACETLFGKLLPFFPETSIREVQTEESKRYRADIIIFLGRDITVSTLE